MSHRVNNEEVQVIHENARPHQRRQLWIVNILMLYLSKVDTLSIFLLVRALRFLR